MCRNSVSQYLRQLCRDIDQGNPLRRYDWKRAIVLPVAVGLTVGAGACGNDNTAPEPVEVYGTPSSMSQSDSPQPAQPSDDRPTPSATPPVLDERDAGADAASAPQSLQIPVDNVVPPAGGVYGAPLSERDPL